jgi:hypothetical protein
VKEKEKKKGRPDLSITNDDEINPARMPSHALRHPCPTLRQGPHDIKEQISLGVEHVRLLRELDLVVVEGEPLLPSIISLLLLL